LLGPTASFWKGGWGLNFSFYPHVSHGSPIFGCNDFHLAKNKGFFPLIFGYKKNETDQFTSAEKAFRLSFLFGLKFAPHMLHMMAWILKSIFKSPLVTVISKTNLTLVSAPFLGYT